MIILIACQELVCIGRIWFSRQTSIWSTFSRWVRHAWTCSSGVSLTCPLWASQTFRWQRVRLPFSVLCSWMQGKSFVPFAQALTFVCTEVVSEGFSPSRLAAQKPCTAKIHIGMHRISRYCHFFWSHCEVTGERGKWGQAVLAEGSEEKKLWVILCGKLN